MHRCHFSDYLAVYLTPLNTGIFRTAVNVMYFFGIQKVSLEKLIYHEVRRPSLLERRLPHNLEEPLSNHDQVCSFSQLERAPQFVRQVRGR